MAYERLGDLHRSQRLGAFDGLLGDVASAQRDYDNAMSELKSAQESLVRINSEVNQPIQCSAIPNSPVMPKLACPTTAADASKKLAAAQQRFKAASDTVSATKSALDSEKSAVQTGEVLKGVAAIAAPLAQAGVGIFQAQSQAQLEKARLKAQGAGFDPMALAMMSQSQAPAKSSNTALFVIGGLMLVGAVVAVVALTGDKKKAEKPAAAR